MGRIDGERKMRRAQHKKTAGKGNIRGGNEGEQGNVSQKIYNNRDTRRRLETQSPTECITDVSYTAVKPTEMREANSNMIETGLRDCRCTVPGKQ